MSRGKRPKWILNIANERINILFNLAENEFFTHPERSHRYGHNLGESCHKFLFPGQNCSIRLVNCTVNIKCSECGHIMKIPYIKEIKSKRRAKIESYIKQKRNYE